MNKKKLGTIFVTIILVDMISIYYNNTKELYGNDKDSIVKVIKSIEGYEDKYIEILEIKDLSNLRIVAFLSNHSPGYIEFYKNKEGNYVWRHIEVRSDESFSSFLIHLDNTDSPKFMFITNNENEVAKMQVNINEHKLEQEFLPNQATVTWVDLPQTNKDHYEFRKYKFYDKAGNQINEYE
jgi:hypothetical protein